MERRLHRGSRAATTSGRSEERRQTMNTNMNVTIRHLTNAFILLFLVLSGVAAYVQIGNAAPLGGQQLAGGAYETRQRQCPPVDKPLRGRILDRNGNLIAE